MGHFKDLVLTVNEMGSCESFEDRRVAQSDHV